MSTNNNGAPALDFSEEQKQYLQGFLTGVDSARASHGLPTFNGTLAALGQNHGGATQQLPTGPEAIHFAAQDRITASGKKIVPEEKAKRDKFPLDAWDDIKQHAAESKFPKTTDILAFKYHGLFYVAPAQNSYMCRLRFHGGMMTSFQMKRLAEISDAYAGGYSHVTTRSNLQIREIKPENALRVLEELHDAAIITRGSGADNIRNITGSPTAGIDGQELFDVRPLCRELQHYIFNHREMYGLPRKFNISFDGGGRVSCVEDTNDIGFVAVQVNEEKAQSVGIEPGVYFRMNLGGITGHLDYARDTGILLKPNQCVPMAAAVVRVFIENGDRTDRKKARLKYLLDAWGFEKFLAETEKQFGAPLPKYSMEICEPRPRVDRMAHVGVHPQKQDGLFYIGVVLPVGKLTTDQMRGIAKIADVYGSGSIRLTVWQNLLISDIAPENIEAAQKAIEDLGLDWKQTNVRAGIISCTGNAGCKFAASDTKRHAMEVASQLDRVSIDTPLNIHFTGCPHSCAQHYIGDLGFLGTRVEKDDDTVEGYHVFIGGGAGEQQGIAQELFRDVVATDAPALTEKMLRAYLANRSDVTETFLDWSRRHTTEELRNLISAAN